MEKGLDKLLKKLVIKKYPMYLDVQVSPYEEGSLRYENPYNRKRYEVLLVIHEKDYRYDIDYNEIWNYVRDIGSYMNVEVMGVYNRIVDDETFERI